MLELLHSINNQLSGINFKKDDKLFDYLGQIIHTQRYKINQTEVIPIRILQNSIKQRWEQVDLLESNLNGLTLFIENIINIEHYACSNSTYEKYKNSVDEIIKWNEAISDCGLKELFETYNVQNKRLFRSFIKKIQGTVKHLIHAYSGMRDQEAISLKNDCYKEELVDDTNIVRIIGITTKLEGRQRLTNWITSSIIFKAINILREIKDVAFATVDENNQPRNPDWAGVLRQVDTFVHLYGKAEPRKARKMGHVNFVGKRMEKVVARCETAMKTLGLSGGVDD